MQCYVNCYGFILRRKDGHVLRNVLDFEVRGYLNRLILLRTLMKQLDEKCTTA